MDSDLKNLKGTIDNTPEGIKVSPNTEESRKEIEIREYQGVISVSYTHLDVYKRQP